MTKIKNFYIMLCVLMASLVSAQTSFYVSASTGNDTKDGKTWQTAFRTIDKAFMSVTTAGTYNIYVAKGVYTPSNYQVFLDGNKTINMYGNFPVPSIYTPPVKDACGGSPAAPPGTTTSTDNLTVLNGVNVTSAAQFGIVANTSNNTINIQGFKITGYMPGGNAGTGLHPTLIGVNDGATNTKIIVSNNNFDGMGSNTYGVIGLRGATGVDITVENNILQNNIRAAGQGGGFLAAIGSAAKNVKAVIRNNAFNNYTTQGTIDGSTIFSLRLNNASTSSVLYDGNKTYNTKHDLLSLNTAGVLELNNIEDVTVTNNYFTNSVGGVAGAAHISNALRLTMRNNLWQNNQSVDNGGAITIDGSVTGQALMIDNDKYFGNHIDTFYGTNKGGAVLISQAFTRADIQNSTFTGNSTADAGGAVAITAGSGSYNFTNDLFCNNTSFNAGGAVYVGNGSSLNITTTTFNGNKATSGPGGNGGAVYAGSAATVTQSYFTGNTAASNGGAIVADNALSISNVNFDSNKTTVRDGGAVYISDTSGTTSHNITNATFANNTSAGDGGAIGMYTGLLQSQMPSATVAGSNFTNNIASGNGGAVYFSNYSLTTNSNVFNGNAAVHGGAVQDNTTLTGNTSWKSNTDVFRGNTAKNSANTIGNGGAVNIATAAQSMNVTFTSAKFYSNTAARDGGAVWVDARNSGTYDSSLATGVNFTGSASDYTDFLSNKAGGNGGALYVGASGLVLSFINALNYSRFYGNTAGSGPSSSCLNAVRNSNSDIYLNNDRACTFYGKINNTANSQLQNAVEVYVPGQMGVQPSTTYNAPSFAQAADPVTGAAIVGAQKACVAPPAPLGPSVVPTSSASIGITDSTQTTPVGSLQTCSPVVNLFSTDATPPVSYTYHYEVYNNAADATARANVADTSTQFTVKSSGTSTSVIASNLPAFVSGKYYVFVIDSFTYQYNTGTVDANNNPVYATKTTVYDCSSPPTATVAYLNCTSVCYKTPTDLTTSVPSIHGITALTKAGRNNADTSAFPMYRNSGHTVLEAKTKGFVITRLTTAQINAIEKPVEGMMVYDITQNCLSINTDGTPAGWKCYKTQTCDQ